MGLSSPRLTILLPALRGYDTVAAALDAWDAQTCRDQLEVLVLCPDAGVAPELQPGHRAIDSTGLRLHEARARGVREAHGEFVVIGEDHCLPDPETAEELIRSVDEGWDIVAPALRSADPRTSCARAALAIGYSQWLEPIASGPKAILPGHNAAIRLAALRELDDRLEAAFMSGRFLVSSLMERGNRGYLNADARMRHFDSPSWLTHLGIFASVGLGFGALRTRTWPRVARYLYPLAAPAAVARHYARASRELRRNPDYPRTRPGVLVLAVVWGMSEGVGALLGPDRVLGALERAEQKPVSRDTVARADAAAAEVRTDFRR